MKYLVSQNYGNTENNHAGISYFCKVLQTMYPHIYKCIYVDRTPLVYFFPAKYRYLIKLNMFIRKLRQRRKIKNATTLLLSQVTVNDQIFLMEYLDNQVDYYYAAKTIKEKIPEIRIYGMSHLVPEKLNKMFSDKALIKWMEPIEKVITLGSTLSEYYISRNIPHNRIITLFHPLDDYYIEKKYQKNDVLSIIVQGNQMRDIDMLVKVVKSNPSVLFRICQGYNDYSSILSFANVQLIPFVEEHILKRYMEQSDVSLNIMKDTIGSNVIVTSLGMSLAMICSDVGSIRNYCTEENTFFCKTLDDYNRAINELLHNDKLLSEMQNSSFCNSLNFRIDKFHQYFCDIV